MYLSLRRFIPHSETPGRRRALCLALFRAFLCVALLSGCGSARFIPEGRYLLSDVKLTTSARGIKTGELRGNVRQEPNSRWFSLFKIPLHVYCLSKADSVRGRRGFSGVLRKIGEAPVIYDPAQTAYSVASLRQSLINKGYLRARVDTTVSYRGHKAAVVYHLTPGPQTHVNSLAYTFDDPAVARIVAADSTAGVLRKGRALDLDRLAEERTRIVSLLRNKGYYHVNNDFVTVTIDTLPHSHGADVTLHFARPDETDSARVYTPQRFGRIRVIEHGADRNEIETDSIDYRHLTYLYKGRPFLHKGVLYYHIDLQQDSLYSDRRVQTTASMVSALPAVAYSSTRVYELGDSLGRLGCDITLQSGKPHSIGLELEGTNTAGDLGAAAVATYSNRNLLRGSETFTVKGRLAYEAITGLEGYDNQNYIEYSLETGLRFPTLLMPFVSLDRKRQLNAASEVQLMYDSQNRPEFHRRVLTGAWAYNWMRYDRPQLRHRFDLFSINYVFLPWISSTFRRDYLEGDDPYNQVLRSSYENLFILKTGYSFTYNSQASQQALSAAGTQTSGYQVKAGVELAGNLLRGISGLLRFHRDSEGRYSLFGINFSQYVKFDFDFSKSLAITEKSALAFHAALGLAIPYGNSSILPYEKRYFSGGANSVRGWSVRSLGPGAYKGAGGKVDFINQTGNLKLDLSVEWRSLLFWKIYSALFVDAGNIWNTRHYPNMDDAVFHFDSFHRQIAVAYGLGLRFNFNYFILRLDGGMKAINPAEPSGRLHYPIFHPDFGRDFTLHFAVGLPF